MPDKEPATMRITPGDFRDPRVVDLLQTHLTHARAETAPGRGLIPLKAQVILLAANNRTLPTAYKGEYSPIAPTMGVDGDG